jgi:hypothetical protein
MIQSSLMKEENRSKKVFVRMLLGLFEFTFLVGIFCFFTEPETTAILKLGLARKK